MSGHIKLDDSLVSLKISQMVNENLKNLLPPILQTGTKLDVKEE